MSFYLSLALGEYAPPANFVSHLLQIQIPVASRFTLPSFEQ